MKIDFAIPEDGAYHELCISCHSEAISVLKEEGRAMYLCEECGVKSDRLLVLDPRIVWWVDHTTKEYWHESVGIFVFNPEAKALFFQRNKYPFVLTIPAGHLDTGEDPKRAVIRELKEETGLDLANVKFFAEENVANDKCRRGADHHKWHLYVALARDPVNIAINPNEGGEPVWFNLAQAARQELPVPVKLFVEKYAEKLNEVANEL